MHLKSLISSLLPRAVAAVAALTAPAALVASEPTDTTLLPELSVFGGRPFEEVIPAQHLNGEELERLNSHSVADAVRYFSGVQLKDY